MKYSVFAVGVSVSVVPNVFGPVVVDMILAKNFVCIFEVHKEVLVAGVLGIFTVRHNQNIAVLYA